jgi:hypothetical protein
MGDKPLVGVYDNPSVMIQIALSVAGSRVESASKIAEFLVMNLRSKMHSVVLLADADIRVEAAPPASALSGFSSPWQKARGFPAAASPVLDERLAEIASALCSNDVARLGFLLGGRDVNATMIGLDIWNLERQRDSRPTWAGSCSPQGRSSGST